MWVIYDRPMDGMSNDPLPTTTTPTSNSCSSLARLWPMPWTLAQSALFGPMALRTWFSALPWQPPKDVQVGWWRLEFWKIFSPKNIHPGRWTAGFTWEYGPLWEEENHLNWTTIFRFKLWIFGGVFSIWNSWKLMKFPLVFDRIWQQITLRGGSSLGFICSVRFMF